MMANLRMELIEKKRIAKEYLDMYYFINFCLKMDYQRNYLLKNDKWMSFRDVMTDFRNLSTNEELKKSREWGKGSNYDVQHYCKRHEIYKRSYDPQVVYPSFDYKIEKIFELVYKNKMITNCKSIYYYYLIEIYEHNDKIIQILALKDQDNEKKFLEKLETNYELKSEYFQIYCFIEFCIDMTKCTNIGFIDLVNILKNEISRFFYFEGSLCLTIKHYSKKYSLGCNTKNHTFSSSEREADQIFSLIYKNEDFKNYEEVISYFIENVNRKKEQIANILK